MFDKMWYLPRTLKASYQNVHLKVTPGHWEGLARRNKESGFKVAGAGSGSQLVAVSPPVGKEALEGLGRLASRVSRGAGIWEQVHNAHGTDWKGTRLSKQNKEHVVKQIPRKPSAAVEDDFGISVIGVPRSV